MSNENLIYRLMEIPSATVHGQVVKIFDGITPESGQIPALYKPCCYFEAIEHLKYNRYLPVAFPFIHQM